MSCAQLLRRADELKAKIIEGNAETWVTRQTLLDLYQQILITNLEFALDKKVEQDLWNHVFKNQINILQRKVKDKANPKRTELQATLTLFLDSASGFYLQLLQELCSAFDLRLPCRVTPSKLGILDDKNPNHQKVKQAQHASCLYICQYCLVHLGDLSRYRTETSQAESYYRHAAKLVPSSGQPYNQLAIVAASRGDQLAMTFFYVRSTAVRHPFPAASTNLQSTFAKLVDKDEVKLFKMKLVELIHFFTKFHAVIHLTVGDADLQVASMIRDKLEENFRSHLAQESLSAKQLVQMMAINMFTLHHIKHLDKETTAGDEKDEDDVALSDDLYTQDEIQSWNLTLNLTVTLFQLMLHYIPSKSQEKARQWVCLPAIRVFLDWLIHHPYIFEDDVVVSKPIVWSKLAKLLTFVQYKDSADVLPSNQALWEDIEVDQFLPLKKSHSVLNFDEFNQVKLNSEMESRERVCRLVQHGKWLVENQSGLMKSERAETSSKLIFTCALSEEQVRKQQQKSKQQKLLPSKPKPESKIQTHTNLKTALKKGREGPPRKVEFAGIEEIIHEDRRSENKRPDSKTQSIAVQAILPRKKTSSESDSSITPIGSPPSISIPSRQPVGVFHEQNPIQSPVSNWEPEGPPHFHSGPKPHANTMHNIQSWQGSSSAGTNNPGPYQSFNSSGQIPQGQYQNPRYRHPQPHMQDQGIGSHGMPGSPGGNWSSPQRSPSQTNPPRHNYPGGQQPPGYPQTSQGSKENNPIPGRIPQANWNKGLPWQGDQHHGNLQGRSANQWSNPGDGRQSYQQLPKYDWQGRYSGPPNQPHEMFNHRTPAPFHRPAESPTQLNSPTSSQPNMHTSRPLNNPGCGQSHTGQYPLRARQPSPQSPQPMSMQNQNVMMNHPRVGTPTKSPQSMDGFVFPSAAEISAGRQFNPVNMDRQAQSTGFNHFNGRNSRMPATNAQNTATMQALREEANKNFIGMTDLSKGSKLSLGFIPNGPFSPDFDHQETNMHLRQGALSDFFSAMDQEVNFSDDRSPFQPPYGYGYPMNNDGSKNMAPKLVTPDDRIPSPRQTPSPAVNNQRLAITFPGLDSTKNTGNRAHGFNNVGGSKPGFFEENIRSTGAYTLFTPSPWTAGQDLVLPSSPFVSQPTSPNATPRSQSPIHQGTLGLTENLPGIGLSWRDERTNNVWGSSHQLSSSPTSSLLPERLQSIWSSPIGSSSEPSPLEMLLRQQQQKQHHHDT
ncbi:protein SMG7-like isoform X2 [Anneissia japonica]|uniref:protein SMG7-like isoform X2 n=1 Tax=Anneissia japonica TaxID=1529436 RepID=UPI001425B4DA|nr:protein SMG7-like isoform X2 [Anneissia japonica]